MPMRPPAPLPVGRFAPSPTGTLHVGNLRTAMLAWLFARSAGSRFVLRIEDLDPTTARPEHERSQLADLVAIGLDWDGPVVRQSERRQRHDAVIADLIMAGRTYPCWCTRREIQAASAAAHGEGSEGVYPGTCASLSVRAQAERDRWSRPPALRLRAEGERIAVIDRLCGPYEAVVDDLVLRRGDRLPAYNLAVVVDDAFQGVGEVVRGDDLLSSTPRQMLVARLLGLALPAYAHVPLVLGGDGARLAKRHGAVTLADLAARGIDAATVRSRLATSIGLAAPDEPVTMADLVARFDPSLLPRTPLRWVD